MEIDGVKMNEIESMFYNAFMGAEDCEAIACELTPQKVIGPYKVDFACMGCAIEIDGHEYHKTKEQRDHDYKRERYLLRSGYVPIRFTGTEVYLNPLACVRDAAYIINSVEFRQIDAFIAGQESIIKKNGGKNG